MRPVAERRSKTVNRFGPPYALHDSGERHVAEALTRQRTDEDERWRSRVRCRVVAGVRPERLEQYY